MVVSCFKITKFLRFSYISELKKKKKKKKKNSTLKKCLIFQEIELSNPKNLNTVNKTPFGETFIIYWLLKHPVF